MPLWTCDSSGCTKEMKSVVLDANWRWLHNGEYTNCLVPSKMSGSSVLFSESQYALVDLAFQTRSVRAGRLQGW